MQEPERDADPRELGVDRVPIRVRMHRPRLLALREQAGVHLPGAHPFRFLPGDVVLGRGPEHVGDAGLRRVQRGGDRVERQVRRPQPEHPLAGILLAMVRSFLSTTGMASRAYGRRTGGARAGMRAVLERAAGGTEGQYSRFWMAVLKRATGGTKKDDYSTCMPSAIARRGRSATTFLFPLFFLLLCSSFSTIHLELFIESAALGLGTLADSLKNNPISLVTQPVITSSNE